MVQNHWRDLYRAAVLELDLRQLQFRVKAAEDAIRAHAAGHGEISREERIAIEDAMSALRVMKQEGGAARFKRKSAGAST
jgi:hypothetical protein